MQVSAQASSWLLRDKLDLPTITALPMLSFQMTLPLHS